MGDSRRQARRLDSADDRYCFSRSKIEGGTFHPIEFAVQTTSVTGLSEGQYGVRCLFDTNTVNGLEVVRCDIKAMAVSVYDGVLAIDFGTSNTCCAMLHRTANDHEMVPLDAHNSTKPTTAPTVSYYLSEPAKGLRNVNHRGLCRPVASRAEVVAEYSAFAEEVPWQDEERKTLRGSVLRDSGIRYPLYPGSSY